MNNMFVLIPAYNPDHKLSQLIDDLNKLGVLNIVVVNDGSTDPSHDIFKRLHEENAVRVLEHATNMGKGQAIKTGLRYIYETHPDCLGVVIADADGQHLPQDIVNVRQTLIEHPQSLVIGSRRFQGDVPWRSKFGNQLTNKLFSLVIGVKLPDTQSGLRGLPKTLIPLLLKTNSRGYEFELDMLIIAKNYKVELLPLFIQTVYMDGNKSSHFNPVFDSLKIYFVLLRFVSLSLTTTLIDFLVFMLAIANNSNIFAAIITARAVAVLFNYPLAKKMVFINKEKSYSAFFKYFLVLMTMTATAYALIMYFHQRLQLPIGLSKVIAETAIYIINFLLQREFVFKRQFLNEN